ncbi:hypothetical protein CCMSSC00406_0006038 [Pleurotus cornucopiae]|uniref:Uncharacterized protein n=1 Tax=Pleurotus cornucopiae TaxID=5321 RepID=A0ACB7INV9_PLECO|nr:hypothetical protein CCMSSC00406_0006038 [Pleurotus cornucopiae]
MSTRARAERRALPVELVSEIIDIVAPQESNNPHPVTYMSNADQEAFRTLVAASLVSHSWNAVCRRHIFHTVFMFSSNTSTRLSFLHFQAPHLAEYIRRLYVWWNDDDPRPASECQWLAECLYRMKNFRELILVSILAGLPTERRILAAGAMPILYASRLRKLSLRDWDFAEDAYDLPGMLSPTLEELVLENIRTENIEMEAPPTTHLAALRRLVLVDTVHPMLSAENIIECRCLQYLELQWLHDTDSWNMPPWIPASLSEFALISSSRCALPNFGQTIRPSVVKVTLFGNYGPLSGLFTWIKDCIDRLPFPNLIKVLKISILKSFSTPTGVDGFLPETSDYEMLSRFLQPLWRDGVLENFALTIITSIDGDHDVAPDSARESVKLNAAFAGLLPANVSDVRFIVGEQFNFRMTRATVVDMRWGIQRL